MHISLKAHISRLSELEINDNESLNGIKICNLIKLMFSLVNCVILGMMKDSSATLMREFGKQSDMNLVPGNLHGYTEIVNEKSYNKKSS